MRILLTVAYDGTDYCGWQYQNNSPTVQEALEKALHKVFNKNIRVSAASRTDAGVHALGQCAAFDIDECRIPIEKLCHVINGRLPADIAVKTAEYVERDFNPRFLARKKTYIYRIYNSTYPDPLKIRYAWYIPYQLDYAAMSQAAAYFTGKHDFAGFRTVGGNVKTTTRTIYECNLIKDGNLLELIIRGDGFLYNMVRIITGTLVYVGAKKIMPDMIPDIIESRDRKRAGRTAPAQGLCLYKVEF